MDNYWNFCFTFGKGGEVAGTGGNDDGGIVYAAGPQVILQVQVIGLVGQMEMLTGTVSNKIAEFRPFMMLTSVVSRPILGQ